jgi:hypothetical protein
MIRIFNSIIAQSLGLFLIARIRGGSLRDSKRFNMRIHIDVDLWYFKHILTFKRLLSPQIKVVSLNLGDPLDSSFSNSFNLGLPYKFYLKID